MASCDFSSDSEIFLNGASPSRKHPHRRTRHSVNDKVINLATNLQDTNRNLKAVDHMLGEYQAIGDLQGSAMNKLRDDLGQSPGRWREEKGRRTSRDSQTSRSLRPSDLEDDHSRSRQRRRGGPTSPHRAYDRPSSGREHDRDVRPRDGRRGSSSAVRFYDDMGSDENLHELHQSVRDLTSDQIRMEEDLNREIDRRNRLEMDNRKIREIAESLKKPEVDKAMSSVDKRLQNIQDELRAERLMLKKADKVSAELKQALEQQKTLQAPPPPVDVDAELRSKLAQTISDKTLVETELEKIRRKLDQSEGRCQALGHQMDEIRKQLARSEDEKTRYKTHYDQAEQEMRERRKRIADEDHERGVHEKERRHLESEVQELRSQLARSVSVVSEVGELRTELERSERQRTQLSDHIEGLKKEVDEKERQQARVITQLHEMSEKYEEAEQHKLQTLLQLQDTMKRLDEATKELEESNRELRDSQHESGESQRRTGEIKTRAQETVRQWKLKCKKLERDLEKYRHSAEQAQSRSDHFIKDLEMTKSQHSSSAQQLEHLKREFAELLAIRAQQDEQVRMKDVQVNELKSLKLDMENDLRDCKMVIERLEHELHTFRERVHSATEEKNKAEDQLSGLQAARVLVESQLQQLQTEVREMSQSKVEGSSQLAEAMREKQELKQGLKELRRSELTARETVEALQKRLKEEKEVHHKRLEAISSELAQYKSQESAKVVDLTRRFRKQHVEMEAELQALKMDRVEERNNVKNLKRQLEQCKIEIESLSQELGHSQEENSQLEKKYLHLREELISRSELTENGITRARDVELDLLDAKENIVRMEKDYQNILHTIGAEVDSVIEVAAFYSVETYKALSLSKGLNSQPHKLLAEVQSKLEWLKNELRENRQKEQLMRTEVRDVVMNNDKDRQFLIAEIQRQNHVLDDLTTCQAKTENISRERDIDQHVENNIRSTNGFVSDDEELPDHFDLAELSSTPKAKQLQRDKIREKYARLQETVESLRQELSETNSYNNYSKFGSNRNGSSIKKTPNSTPKKVRISSPPAQETPPQRRGALNNGYTPPPLSLTDEEFRERFLPKSPHLSPHKINQNDSIL